jgi:hypothetical protein
MRDGLHEKTSSGTKMIARSNARVFASLPIMFGFQFNQLSNAGVFGILEREHASTSVAGARKGQAVKFVQDGSASTMILWPPILNEESCEPAVGR